MKNNIYLSIKNNYVHTILIVLMLFSINEHVSAQNSKLTSLQKIESLEKKDKNSKKDIDQMLQIIQSLSIEQDSLALIHLKIVKTKIEQVSYYSAWVNYSELLFTLHKKSDTPINLGEELNQILSKKNTKLSSEDKKRIQQILLKYFHDEYKYEEVIHLAKSLLSSKINIKDQATILYLRGDSYQELGRYTDATKDFLNALDDYQSENDVIGIIDAYSGLGNIKRKLNDTIQSLKYYQKALEYAENQEDIKTKIEAYSNVGVGYRNLDSFDIALKYFQKGLDLAEKHGITLSILRINLNMGNVYSDMGNYIEALKRYFISLNGSKNAGNDIGTFLNYKNISHTYNLLKEYPKAKIFIDSANIYAEKLQLPGERAGIYYEYSTYFKGIGNYKQALDYLIQATELKDKIINENTTREVNELQVKYETASKDLEILKINKALLEKKSQTRTLLLISISLAILALSLALFLIYRNKLLNQLYLRNVELINNTQSIVEESLSQVYNESISKEDLLQNKIYLKIIELLESEKIYTNPYLSIGDLADKVGSNEKYVSNAISTYAKINYSNLINSYRINEAKSLIYKNKYHSLNEVMTASGFNSRTAFYTAFNKHTGMSPKQFKDMSAVKSI